MKNRETPLQNIPIRTETGKQIRAAFRRTIPQALLDADYASLESKTVAQVNNPKCSDTFQQSTINKLHKDTAPQ